MSCGQIRPARLLVYTRYMLNWSLLLRLKWWCHPKVEGNVEIEKKRNLHALVKILI